MKRVIIAVILLLSAVSVSVWSNITFEKSMKEFSSMLENLIDSERLNIGNVLFIGVMI